MTDDDASTSSTYMSLPSERFNTTGEALTYVEWLRRHAITYPEDRKVESA